MIIAVVIMLLAILTALSTYPVASGLQHLLSAGTILSLGVLRQRGKQRDLPLLSDLPLSPLCRLYRGRGAKDLSHLCQKKRRFLLHGLSQPRGIARADLLFTLHAHRHPLPASLAGHGDREFIVIR